MVSPAFLEVAHHLLAGVAEVVHYNLDDKLEELAEGNFGEIDCALVGGAGTSP